MGDAIFPLRARAERQTAEETKTGKLRAASKRWENVVVEKSDLNFESFVALFLEFAENKDVTPQRLGHSL